LLKLRAIRLLS
jgi:hypothetical protein